jgi:hypothetical protein
MRQHPQGPRIQVDGGGSFVHDADDRSMQNIYAQVLCNFVWQQPSERG